MFNGMEMKWYRNYKAMVQENVENGILYQEDADEMEQEFTESFNKRFGAETRYQLFWMEDEGEIVILVKEHWFHVCEGNCMCVFVPVNE